MDGFQGMQHVAVKKPLLAGREALIEVLLEQGMTEPVPVQKCSAGAGLANFLDQPMTLHQVAGDPPNHAPLVHAEQPGNDLRREPLAFHRCQPQDLGRLRVEPREPFFDDAFDAGREVGDLQR